MDFKPFYELKERLEHAAISGTRLIAEDFRLKRAIEALAPLASAGPVFAKINAASCDLLVAPAGDRAAKLLDVLSLVDAVAYTLGATGVQGELSPLTGGSGSYVHASYSQLQPLIIALSGTGSGRMAIITDYFDNHPEYFGDFRVLPNVISALGGNYSEVSDLAEQILIKYGSSVVPLLKEDFKPDGKKEMVRRVRIIARLSGANENEWFKEVLPYSKKNVREMLIYALGLSHDNTQILLDLCRSERGSMKNAALRSLACMETEESRAYWEEEIKKNPSAVWILEGVNSQLASDLAAKSLCLNMESLLSDTGEFDEQHYNTLRHYISAAYGKYSDRMRELWFWISEHMEQLNKFTQPKNSSASGYTVAGLLQKCINDTVPYNPCTEVFSLVRELGKQNPKWFLGAEFLADLVELEPEEVYEKYSKYLLDRNTALEKQHVQIIQNLFMITYKEGGYGINFRKNNILNGEYVNMRTPICGFDPRWASLITDMSIYTDIKVSVLYNVLETHDLELAIDSMVQNLIDPNSSECCTAIGKYIYNRAHKTGHIYSYMDSLILCGRTNLRGLLAHSVKKSGEASWYSVRNTLETMPISSSEKAAELKEIDSMVKSKNVNVKFGRWPDDEIKTLIAKWEADTDN